MLGDRPRARTASEQRRVDEVETRARELRDEAALLRAEKFIERDQTLKVLYDDLLYHLDGELELLKLEALST
jgi:hypothetical protein